MDRFLKTKEKKGGGMEKQIIEIEDGKNEFIFKINGVDFVEYLVSYNISSTPDSKELDIKLLIPSEKIKVQVCS